MLINSIWTECSQTGRRRRNQSQFTVRLSPPPPTTDIFQGVVFGQQSLLLGLCFQRWPCSHSNSEWMQELTGGGGIRVTTVAYQSLEQWYMERFIVSDLCSQPALITYVVVIDIIERDKSIAPMNRYHLMDDVNKRIQDAWMGKNKKPN